MPAGAGIVARHLGVEVHEHGSRYVTGVVGCPSGPAVEIPPKVDHPKILVVEVPGKPAALDQGSEGAQGAKIPIPRRANSAAMYSIEYRKSRAVHPEAFRSRTHTATSPIPRITAPAR
jgi:hypothetical protein